MPKDQTSNKHPEPRFFSPYPELSSSRTGGNSFHDATIARLMPPPLFEEGAIIPPPLTSPDITPRSRHIFENAHDFQVGPIHYNLGMPNVRPIGRVDGWEVLIQNMSPNALHNASARYDAPKCDEDTRVEVTTELMDHIKDWDGPQPLLCLTGAAGSGKSTLQQTIAECCAESGILGSAYFFSREDPTRNTISTVLPTIAFQLGLHNPDLKQAIVAAPSSLRDH
ncbi:hypothetical protein H1R20_g16357, partial [Candolleomyces eurysporus]